VFYGSRLGLESLGGHRFRVGESEVEFVPSGGDPFYHFALLVPGDRFDAALEWVRERVELLPDRETGDAVFDFSNWDALACYFEDPAGNIVELIAHREMGPNGVRGPFDPGELLGFSELGLVGEPKTIAAALQELDLNLWDGTVDEPGRLAFIGEKGRTLILSPPGRGWLPTGRPAEPHPVEVVLSDGPRREIQIEGHRIRRGG
jgi:catechol 2,3-dioxygenase-like lactoylglutathione lyase family enzyme